MIYSHHVKDQIGREAVSIAEDITKNPSDVDGSWDCKRSNDFQSSVGCLQLSSDKSRTSLDPEHSHSINYILLF